MQISSLQNENISLREIEVINTMQFRIQDELLLADNLRSLILTNIKIFHQTKESMLSAAQLAKKHSITFYDSSYLYLAILKYICNFIA